MGEWRRVSLGDVADEVTVGHVGSMTHEYRRSGIPFLRSQNVRPHRVDLTDVKFIDDDFHTKLKKSALSPGDVVTVRTGNPGVSAVIPESLAVANCSDLVITRPGPDLDAKWLSYYMNYVITSHIDGHLVGAVQQHFNVKSAKQLELFLPEIAEQRRISSVLAALDDKIATNERVLESADTLARSVWNEATVGGQPVPLSQLANFVNGRAFTKGATGAGRVVVRIAELNSGIGSSTVYNDIQVPEEHLVRPGDLLFAWSGSLTVARWYRPEAIVNQHIFKVIPKPDYPMWLVNQAVRSKLADFKAIASDKATTMGHIQRRHLDEPIPIAKRESVERIDATMSALWSAALAAEVENLRLAATRDELLPLLMSGRVTVKASEQIVGDST